MRRYRFALVLLWVFLGAIGFRLIHLQILQHELWAAQAQHIQQQEVIRTLQRGKIYDRNGILLAEDIPAVSIALDNSQMTRPEKLQELLQQYLRISPADAHQKIYRQAFFTWIKRRVDLTTADQLRTAARANQVHGLLFIDDYRRSYPQRDLASNLIGFTNTDNLGIEGLELQFDSWLRGSESVIAIRSMGDRSRTEIRRQILQEGTPGKDLNLTIDSRVQQLAEEAISAGVKRYMAKSGYALVMNVRTGEVEAMAQDQRFDLNYYQFSAPEQRKNQAITVPFEPGSSAKVFTMLAALEADPGIVNRVFNGSASYRPPVLRKQGNQIVTTYPRAFRNSENRSYGWVSPTQIIQDSINTAIIQVAYEVLGPPRLYEHLMDFGFAQKTGILLPGEVTGTLRAPDPLNPTELGDYAIGQAFSVTGIQLATAVCAIANGGIWMRPEIVLGHSQLNQVSSGKLSGDRPRLIAHRENTLLLTQMMEAAVRSGTGTPAQIPGYPIAAKSGTAQKASPGIGYERGKYTSLFVGFLPANDPQYLILVVLDEVRAKEYYGGRTAGPIFKEMAQGILKLKGIAPTLEVP
jgi:cell division protein FtsI/penicillin-binding protein 2